MGQIIGHHCEQERINPEGFNGCRGGIFIKYDSEYVIFLDIIGFGAQFIAMIHRKLSCIMI